MNFSKNLKHVDIACCPQNNPIHNEAQKINAEQHEKTCHIFVKIQDWFELPQVQFDTSQYFCIWSIADSIGDSDASAASSGCQLELMHYVQ